MRVGRYSVSSAQHQNCEVGHGLHDRNFGLKVLEMNCSEVTWKGAWQHIAVYGDSSSKGLYGSKDRRCLIICKRYRRRMCSPESHCENVAAVEMRTVQHTPHKLAYMVEAWRSIIQLREACCRCTCRHVAAIQRHDNSHGQNY